jgi:hypothetical protein
MKHVKLTESDLRRLVSKIINEQVMQPQKNVAMKGVDPNKPSKQTNQNPWSNYPCVANYKDEVSPKGQKSKRGDGIFSNTLFYPNGRAMDNSSKKMYFFKCDPLGIIVGEELEGLEIDV